MKAKAKYYFKYFMFFVVGFLLATWFLAGEVELEKERLRKLNEGVVLKGEANTVAVSNTGEGLIGKVKVEVYDGDGRVLINTNPFLEPDTQYSANIAKLVAQNTLEVSLSNKNVIFDFDIEVGDDIGEGQVGIVGGPSAGAAMTLALISALEGKKVDESKVVTGAILPEGEIGWVGSIIEKGESVYENNLTEFLIPAGQTQFKYYERQVTKGQRGSLTIYRTKYIPKLIDIFEYFEGRIKVREVKNIQDVMSYLLKD